MFLQQGDVLLTKVAKDKISKTAKRVAPVRGRLILAEGEATGHAHAVTTEEGINSQGHMAGGRHARV